MVVKLLEDPSVPVSHSFSHTFCARNASIERTSSVSVDCSWAILKCVTEHTLVRALENFVMFVLTKRSFDAFPKSDCGYLDLIPQIYVEEKFESIH